MAGFKERLKASVQYRLSLSLAMAIVVMALAAGLFSFMSAFHRAQELQDDALFQIAALVSQGERSWPLPEGQVTLEDSDHDSWIYVQALGAATPPPADIASDHRMPTLSMDLADGMHTIQSHGEAYRVFVKTTPHGKKIAVSQETRIRDAVAYRGALNTLLPFLLLVPVLLAIIAQLIHKIFRPITALSRQLDARSENDLRPMPAQHVPLEIRPFILAINRLLARVDESVKNQRRFVADAAHELRSPLTALSLQAERLHHLPMSDAARERLEVLESGIRRGRRLLNQLLSLSRVQAMTDQTPTPICVQDVYRSVLEDFVPLAKKKQIDLGVLEGPDVTVLADELNLTTMLRNLIDNAVRYTPRGGRIDLSATASAHGALIRIADTGPGIPLAERERIFDPFHRILGTRQLGSGLGLAIVKTIAERLDAQIDLAYTDPANETGLTVTIRLPEAVGLR